MEDVRPTCMWQFFQFLSIIVIMISVFAFRYSLVPMPYTDEIETYPANGQCENFSRCFVQDVNRSSLCVAVAGCCCSYFTTEKLNNEHEVFSCIWILSQTFRHAGVGMFWANWLQVRKHLHAMLPTEKKKHLNIWLNLCLWTLPQESNTRICTEPMAIDGNWRKSDHFTMITYYYMYQ